MSKRLAIYAIAVMGLALAACAVLGGGQTDPILSQFIPSTLSDNADVLIGNATQSCNAQAAQEYNLNMVICANPTNFVAQIPGQPFVTPAQIAAAIGAVCATNSYTSSHPVNISVGNCTFPNGNPTPTPVSTPAPAIQHFNSRR
jgi:hypothetical protein